MNGHEQRLVKVTEGLMLTGHLLAAASLLLISTAKILRSIGHLSDHPYAYNPFSTNNAYRSENVTERSYFDLG